MFSNLEFFSLVLFIITIGLSCTIIYLVLYPSKIRKVVNLFVLFVVSLFIIYSLIILSWDTLWSCFSQDINSSKKNFILEFLIPNTVSIVALIHCLWKIIKKISESRRF